MSDIYTDWQEREARARRQEVDELSAWLPGAEARAAAADDGEFEHMLQRRHRFEDAVKRFGNPSAEVRAQLWQAADEEGADDDAE